jgi:hypothetical protein
MLYTVGMAPWTGDQPVARGGPKLIITNHAIIYQLNLNLISMYHGRCGDNRPGEDVEIGFLPPRDADRPDAPHSYTVI